MKQFINGIAWGVLICSLLANYLLWTGKATRPETISDYLTFEHDNYNPKKGK
jgi:hypothetical protein